MDPEGYAKEQCKKTVSDEKASSGDIEVALKRLLGGVKKDACILDIGCRLGCALELMCTMGFDREKLVGVDINGAYMAKIKEAGFRGYCMDVHTDSLDESFDVIWARHVVEHFYDPVKALGCIRSMLKPDGVLCIIVPSRPQLEKYHHYIFDGVDVLVEVLGQAGFEVVFVEEVEKTFGINHQDEIWCKAIKRF